MQLVGPSVRPSVGNIEEEEEEEEEKRVLTLPQRCSSRLQRMASGSLSEEDLPNSPTPTYPARFSRSVGFQSSGLSSLAVSKALLGYHEEDLFKGGEGYPGPHIARLGIA